MVTFHYVRLFQRDKSQSQLSLCCSTSLQKCRITFLKHSLSPKQAPLIHSTLGQELALCALLSLKVKTTKTVVPGIRKVLVGFRFIHYLPYPVLPTGSKTAKHLFLHSLPFHLLPSNIHRHFPNILFKLMKFL